MTRTVSATAEQWPIAGAFRIARGAKTSAEVVVVTVNDGEFSGQGECLPYARYGETTGATIDAIRRVTPEQLTRPALLEALPAGAARNALDWTTKQVQPENLSWLKSLAYSHREGDIEFCHGSPIYPSEFEYIFTREKARELLPYWDRLARVTFIGHSHLTRSFAIAHDDAVDVVAPSFGLRRDHKYIITVGSIGQPRDYDNRSCCAIFDTEANTFKYKRVEYDIEEAKQRIIDAGLSYNFGARLLVGI